MKRDWIIHSQSRKSTIRLAAIVFVVASSGCTQSNAQPSPAELVEEKARIVAEILNSREWRDPIGRPESAGTCEEVTNALSEGLAEFIKPVLITTDMNHPRLAAYQQSCRNFDNWPQGVENSEAAFRSLATIGDEYFELYELNTPGEPGRHELIYTKTTLRSQEAGLFSLRGGVYGIDLDNCVIEGGVTRPGSDIGASVTPPWPVDVNAIVRVSGYNFVVTLYDSWHQGRTDASEPPAYAYAVWRENSPGAFGHVCGAGQILD